MRFGSRLGRPVRASVTTPLVALDLIAAVTVAGLAEMASSGP
ncbi:hypothetical protein [Streptomyces atratus]|nr:hypothetical protein [Streptomyces atratus]